MGSVSRFRNFHCGSFLVYGVRGRAEGSSEWDEMGWERRRKEGKREKRRGRIVGEEVETFFVEVKKPPGATIDACRKQCGVSPKENLILWSVEIE